MGLRAGIKREGRLKVTRDSLFKSLFKTEQATHPAIGFTTRTSFVITAFFALGGNEYDEMQNDKQKINQGIIPLVNKKPVQRVDEEDSQGDFTSQGVGTEFFRIEFLFFVKRMGQLVAQINTKKGGTITTPVGATNTTGCLEKVENHIDQPP
jgi:hypothetical protein